MEKLEEYEYREKPTSVKFNLLVRLVNKITSAIEDALSRIGLLDVNKADRTNVYTKTEVDSKLEDKADKTDVFDKDQCSHFEFGVINIGGPGNTFYWHGQTVYYNGFTSCDYQIGFGEEDFELWICFAHYEAEHDVVLRCELIRGSFNQYKIIEEVTDQERIDKWFGRTIATQEEKGLMSANDKIKLDSVPETIVFDINVERQAGEEPSVTFVGMDPDDIKEQFYNGAHLLARVTSSWIGRGGGGSLKKVVPIILKDAPPVEGIIVRADLYDEILTITNFDGDTWEVQIETH